MSQRKGLYINVYLKSYWSNRYFGVIIVPNLNFKTSRLLDCKSESEFKVCFYKNLFREGPHILIPFTYKDFKKSAPFFQI